MERGRFPTVDRPVRCFTDLRELSDLRERRNLRELQGLSEDGPSSAFCFSSPHTTEGTRPTEATHT